ATAQAIIAPRAPVERPNAAGTAKMPEPIMEPTTREISDGRDSFWFGADSMAPLGVGMGPVARRAGGGQGSPSYLSPPLASRGASLAGRPARRARGSGSASVPRMAPSLPPPAA